MNLPAQDSNARAVQEAMHQHWVLLLVQGLIMAVLGLMAIAGPIFATVAVDMFVGWLFLIVMQRVWYAIYVTSCYRPLA
jgi:uncharacterized membrane protein HdeD (DUF308 family)